MACTVRSFYSVLDLLCVIFLTYMCVKRLCSHGGWLLLKCSAIGIGFNGAETNCGIARILGILLMNSWDTQIHFFSNYYNLQSVYFELQQIIEVSYKSFKKQTFLVYNPSSVFREPLQRLQYHSIRSILITNPRDTVFLVFSPVFPVQAVRQTELCDPMISVRPPLSCYLSNSN